MRFLFLVAATAPLWLGCKTASGKSKDTVVLETNMGDIEIKLYPDKAPKSVENFLKYVDDGFYDGTVFHRVIGNFMIQGGGFTKDMKKKDVRAPIKNEADNGLNNTVGTLAMARTNVVNSATSQFFINVADNSRLDHTGKSPHQYGYAVFGKVTKGMDVVNKIKAVPTCPGRPQCKTPLPPGMRDVPAKPVIIKKARRK